ncbi:hypothetical protein SH601_08300 [Gracilibacillus sp. S3-1-1]|uniref:Uncharacterized protein n=1 Tax=Gracilibacillus pellucidus TaxID=3095368 RepID=A0ACC6M4U0_9BACI|nr:hypothetical protein [Gracilibacillus sp. S3-1-1]MDX8045988.1 hypothetical protein [Gracilibacillus sp. S3-1-1]
MIKSRKIQIVTCLLMMVVLLLLVLTKKTTEEAITYFPPDSSITFAEANTDIELFDMDNNKYFVNWIANSSLEEEIFLRQDVSLIYMDGYLKGIKGLWKESAKEIILDASFEEDESHFYQAISFHHGENHYENDDIRSIQQMSTDNLYIMNSPQKGFLSFEQPSSPTQLKWKEKHDALMEQQKQLVWNDWINDANIEVERYEMYPLIDIIQFQDKPLNDLTQEETNRIIGQLWEGLYRNYIIPIADGLITDKQFMPLILIDKQNDHLIVLFNEDNNKVKILSQQLSID